MVNSQLSSDSSVSWDELEQLTAPAQKQDLPVTQPQTQNKRRQQKQNQHQATGGLNDLVNKADKAPKGTSSPAQKTAAKYKNLEESLSGFYMLIGMGLMPIDQFDAMVFITNANKRAHELVEVAKQNKPFMDFLEKLVNATVYGALITGHISMFATIATHHGLLPEMPMFNIGGIPGTPNPLNPDSYAYDDHSSDHLSAQ